MEAEKRNRFDSLIKHCRPTSSQEAKWESCPFDRIVDSEPDPDLDFSFPSLSPKPSDPTGIFMVSAPDSGSIDQSTPQDDDEMEFHTPPEQHARSSSEDQNVDAGEPKAVDLGDSLRTVDLSEDTLVNGVNELRKNRFLEEELDNDSVLEKKVVSEEDVELEWDGETMPIGETEPAIIEVEGDKNVNDTEVINLETEEIGEELTTINLGDDSVEKMCKEDVAVGKNGEAQKTRESKGFSETLELRVAGVSEELVRVSKNCDLGKSSEPEEVVKASENDCMGRNSEHEEVVKVTEGEKVCNETGGDKDMVICMNLEGIDKFKCVNGGSTERKRKERVCGVDGCVGGTCELPLSMKGKEKNNGSRKVVGNVGIKNGFFNDLLEVLKPVVLDVDNDSQDVDFLEIAKGRGLNFPRPRWWSP